MTQQSTKYQNISCSYYDQLEVYATKKTQCSVIYIAKDLEITSDGIIVDLFAKDGAEYLKLNNGIVIRLDQLISINGILVNNVC
jgi:Rho-binding antiterminator